jgi:hypothetical protein
LRWDLFSWVGLNCDPLELSFTTSHQHLAESGNFETKSGFAVKKESEVDIAQVSSILPYKVIINTL